MVANHFRVGALLLCASAVGVFSGGAGPALPSYDRALVLEDSAETSANIEFGDVDRDGKLDIVLAKGRHWPLVDRVLLGDGRGHVRETFALGNVSDRSYSGHLADLDGDGWLDVVISNDNPDPKLVYLNDGKGRFLPGAPFGQATWSTRNATIADVNGDGRPDIVVANRGEGSSNFVCLNQGNGRFGADCLSVGSYHATTIAAADMNHDGTIDLVIPNRDKGQSYIYLNDGHGGFTDARRVAFGPKDAAVRIASVADFDADGFLDIVTIDELSGVALYSGARGGGFSGGVMIADAKVVPYALVVGDLNDDKKPDIIVGHVEAPSTVYFNGGKGRPFTAVQFGDSKGTVYGFAIGDFDGDRVADIGAARSEATNMVYFGKLPSRR